MDKGKLFNDIKRIGKRRVEYFRRSAKKELEPLRVTGRQLKQQKAFYDEIIETLIRQIGEYRSSPNYVSLEAHNGSVLFENFKILSYNGDQMGKVLGRDGHIYRGVYKESVQAFLKLWNSGLLQVLGENGYVPTTTITDFYTDEYPVILEHSIVDMSTSKSWNRLMIKDACIAISIIKRTAEAVGFTLHDGHLNNMTYHNGRPLFTDIGSIVVNNGQNTAYERELVFAGLYRLVFASIGNNILSRIQIYDEENNSIWITPRYYDDATFEYYKALKKFKWYHLLHSSPLCNWIIFRLFDCYDERPEFIELVFLETAANAFESPQAVADVEQVVGAFERLNLEISSVVDIGGTSGEFSAFMYARLGIKTLSADFDEARSLKAYQRFKEEKIPANTVLFHYLYGADENTRDYVRCDAAVALDITHNLRTYQQWKPDSLLNSLAKMAEKYVAVTFYPDETYDIAGFEANFGGFFEIILKEAVRSAIGGPDGILLVGKK